MINIKGEKWVKAGFTAFIRPLGQYSLTEQMAEKFLHYKSKTKLSCDLSRDCHSPSPQLINCVINIKFHNIASKRKMK